MKNIIIALFISNFCLAQVGIEKTTVEGDGILDFPLGTTKGIILPNVIKSADMTSVTRGTLVYDIDTKNPQYYDGSWRTLNTLLTTGVAPAIRLAGTDLTTPGVIIGSRTSSAEGVLILESSSKALILPKVVNPVGTVHSPVAGMICYDPEKKIMAVYNGKDWSFWK